jgi:hypothetical protein
MNCQTHGSHDHKHGSGCGHQAIQHDGHIDYLHEGHLHHVHDEHVDEHFLGDSDSNKSACTPEHACGSHETSHQHGPSCGHDAIPHGDHVDYLVSGHLHKPCGDHCDHHGQVSLS